MDQSICQQNEFLRNSSEISLNPYFYTFFDDGSDTARHFLIWWI